MSEYTVSTTFDDAIGYFGPPPNDELVMKAKRVRRLLLGKYGELSDDTISKFATKYKVSLCLMDEHVSTFVTIVKSKRPFAFPESTMILRFDDEMFECPVCKTMRHRLSDLIDGEWLPFSDGWKKHNQTDEEMPCVYCQIKGADVLDSQGDYVLCANCIAYGRYEQNMEFHSCDHSDDSIKGPHQIRDDMTRFIEKQEME